MNKNTYPTSRRFYIGLLSLLALISTSFTADAYTIYSYGAEERNRRSSPYIYDTYPYLFREQGFDFRSLKTQGGASFRAPYPNSEQTNNPFLVGFGRWGSWCLGFDTVASSSGVDRSEVEMAPAGPRPGLPFYKPFYTGFSINFPSDFTTPPTINPNFFIAVQWWQVDLLSPPLAMNIKSSSNPSFVPFRFEGQRGNPDLPVGDPNGKQAFDTGIAGSLAKGYWYDFVVKYIFDPNENGQGTVQVWLATASPADPPYFDGYNGKMGYYGTFNGKSIGERVNQKFGLYRGAQNASNKIYFDELTVSTNWTLAIPGQDKVISPVAHLTFDNTTANDGHGNSAGAVTQLVRGPTYSTDSRKGSRSLNFNASQRQYVHLASGGTSFYNEEGFNHTVSMWIKPDTVNGTQVLYDRSNTKYGFLLRLVGDKIEGCMKSYRHGLDGEIFKVNSIYATPVGAWTHVALTYEPQSLKMYINGSLRDSEAIPNYHSDFVISEGGAVLGGRVSGALEGGSGAGDYYDGKIDDVWIYNKTLTPSEIYNLVHY